MTSESATLFSNVDFPAADYSEVLTHVVFKQICLEKPSLKRCTVMNHLCSNHMILLSLLMLERKHAGKNMAAFSGIENQALAVQPLALCGWNAWYIKALKQKEKRSTCICVATQCQHWYRCLQRYIDNIQTSKVVMVHISREGSICWCTSNVNMLGVFTVLVNFCSPWKIWAVQLLSCKKRKER